MKHSNRDVRNMLKDCGKRVSDFRKILGGWQYEILRSRVLPKFHKIINMGNMHIFKKCITPYHCPSLIKKKILPRTLRY